MRTPHPGACMPGPRGHAENNVPFLSSFFPPPSRHTSPLGSPRSASSTGKHYRQQRRRRRRHGSTVTTGHMNTQDGEVRYCSKSPTLLPNPMSSQLSHTHPPPAEATDADPLLLLLAWPLLLIYHVIPKFSDFLSSGVLFFLLAFFRVKPHQHRSFPNVPTSLPLPRTLPAPSITTTPPDCQHTAPHRTANPNFKKPLGCHCCPCPRTPLREDRPPLPSAP